MVKMTVSMKTVILNMNLQSNQYTFLFRPDTAMNG